MSASDARKKRGGTTLLQRAVADPKRAARIDKLARAADIEQMVQAIMASQRVNAAELARRLNAKPPQISRDLHGGLRKATLARLAVIAEALDYDFVPALVPRADSSQRDKFFDAYRDLMPKESDAAAGHLAPPRSSKAKSPRTARKRQYA